MPSTPDKSTNVHHLERFCDINNENEFNMETKPNFFTKKQMKNLIKERKKNGKFIDWFDVQNRVKGIGIKTIEKMINSKKPDYSMGNYTFV